MLKSIVLTSLIATGGVASALNLTFDKALKVELDRCERVMPIKQITEFAMMIEYGFMSEEQIKTALGDDVAARFTELVKVATPYLNSLDERGEVVDLTGADDLTVSCAKYAKGVLITPYQKLVFEMLMNALTPKT